MTLAEELAKRSHEQDWPMRFWMHQHTEDRIKWAVSEALERAAQEADKSLHNHNGLQICCGHCDQAREIAAAIRKLKG